MEKRYKYTIGNENYNFNLSTEKSIHYIYGKNGSGKTMFSRECKECSKDNCIKYVFNKDYISSNIYTEELNNEISENKQGAAQKEKTFQIFLGEELKELKEEEMFVNERNNEIDNINLEYSIDVKFMITGAEEQKIIDKFKIEINETLIQQEFKKFLNQKKPMKEFEQNIEKIINDTKLKISSNEEFKNIEKAYKTLNHLENINKFINITNDLLENIDNLNSKIKKYNEIEILKNDKLEFKEWIEKGIELHEKQNKDDCQFCDSKFSENKLLEIEKELNKITNKKYELKNKIEEECKKISENNIIKLIEQKSMMEDIDTKKYSKKYEELERLKNNLKHMKKSSINEKIVEINLQTFNKEKKQNKEIKTEEFKKLLGEKGYFLCKEEDIKRKLRNEIIKNLIDQKKKEISANISGKIGENSSKYSDRMNEFLKQLDIKNIELELKINKQSSSKGKTLELKIKGNHEFKNLSEGELSALSFSYFLTNFEMELNKQMTNEDSKDLMLFIDDPFTSNDINKVFKMSEIQLNVCEDKFRITEALGKLNKEKNIKTDYILTTHNILIFQILLSNLIDGRNDKGEIKVLPKLDKSIQAYRITEGDNERSLSEVEIKKLFIDEYLMVDKIYEIYMKYISLEKKEVVENDFVCMGFFMEKHIDVLVDINYRKGNCLVKELKNLRQVIKELNKGEADGEFEKNLGKLDEDKYDFEYLRNIKKYIMDKEFEYKFSAKFYEICELRPTEKELIEEYLDLFKNKSINRFLRHHANFNYPTFFELSNFS